MPASAGSDTFAIGFEEPEIVTIPTSISVQHGRDYLLTILENVRKIKREGIIYKHSGTIPTLDSPDPSIDVEFATETLLNQLVLSDERREKFIRFLREGHKGIVAHDGETLIARGWICVPESKSVPYNLPEFITDLDVYWLFHARTREAYRGRGWHKYLVCRRLQWIYNREPNAAVFTDTAPENVSRYTFASTNFNPCGTMTTYRIGHPSIQVKQFGRWDIEAVHPPLPDTH